MSEQLPKAIYGSPDRPLRIGDIEIPCYVLEDGRRVLTQQGFLQALGRSRTAKGGTGAEKARVDRLPAFLVAGNLKPFISHELIASTRPIRFKTTMGTKAFGYLAELLPEVCRVYLNARDVGALAPNQSAIALKCDILIRGFATVGIIALVDEATGYQYDRDRDALYKILEAYISKELLPWAKRFPDEFYKHLFRLHGWQYSPPSVKRPRLVGKLTEELVYKQLPPGVLDELRNKNPKDEKGRRRHKLFQFLTEDIGDPHLQKQIVKVVTLMQISRNWRAFKTFFAQAHPGPIQGDMFPEDAE